MAASATQARLKPGEQQHRPGFSRDSSRSCIWGAATQARLKPGKGTPESRL